jgi:glyoxylase-like metal-dependent hydrolase (beta-lactamase superfamily II)
MRLEKIADGIYCIRGEKIYPQREGGLLDSIWNANMYIFTRADGSYDLLDVGFARYENSSKEDDPELKMRADFLGNIKINRVVATHNHLDHTFAHRKIRDKKLNLFLNEDFDTSLPYGTDDLRKDFMDYFAVEPYELRKKQIESLLGVEIIEMGKYKLEIIPTPSHSPTDVCFYEEENGILFTGDVINVDRRGKVRFPSDRDPKGNPLIGSDANKRMVHIKTMLEKKINILCPAHVRILHAQDKPHEKIKSEYEKLVINFYSDGNNPQR